MAKREAPNFAETLGSVYTLSDVGNVTESAVHTFPYWIPWNDPTLLKVLAPLADALGVRIQNERNVMVRKVRTPRFHERMVHQRNVFRSDCHKILSDSVC